MARCYKEVEKEPPRTKQETDQMDNTKAAALLGREPYIGQVFGPVDLDPTDTGTALLLLLRAKHPEADFYQPGRCGSPVTQINDRVSYCVIFINDNTASTSDHENIEEDDADCTYDLTDPLGRTDLLAAIELLMEPYRTQ